MRKTVVIELLRKYFSTQPVLKAWLFGSFSRGEETQDSDVDIIVSLDKSKPIGLKFFGMWSDLEELLGRKVDLVSEGTLLPFAKESAERDKILCMRERIRDKSRLEHILQAIERIRRYTKGKTFDDFIADDMMYYAVVKNIEIIGEASNMLTEEFRNAHPDTPWKLVNGMRNYIVHEYFQVDNNVVWDVITGDLPLLEKQIIAYIMEEPN